MKSISFSYLFSLKIIIKMIKSVVYFLLL